jgi:hypothetical protein
VREFCERARCGGVKARYAVAHSLTFEQRPLFYVLLLQYQEQASEFNRYIASLEQSLY